MADKERKPLTALLTGAPELSDWRLEYRALWESCGLAGRPDRGVVRVSGQRCAEMLNGLVTNQLIGLEGTGRHALLLTAKGRVLTDLRVFPEKDAMILDVPRSGLANLLATFKKYLPPIYAVYEDLSSSWHQIAVYGPEAAAAVREAISDVPPDEHLALLEFENDGERLLAIRGRGMSVDGVEFVGPGTAIERLAPRLLAAVTARGGREVGMRALEILRVESGVPLYGVDMSEENLAQETGLEEAAISYNKGCYLGQEVVARVHFRGHVNRQLRGLRFADEAAPKDASLHDKDRQVGLVTSSVTSPDLGPIGLGYVRRELTPGNLLNWSGGARAGSATVVALPFR